MPTPPIHLNNLAVAVQNAVEQALGKQGAVPLGHLWVGFVAPDTIATEVNANKIATLLAKEGEVTGVGSVAQLGAAAGTQAKGAAPAVRPDLHIIGLIYAPRATKS